MSTLKPCFQAVAPRLGNLLSDRGGRSACRSSRPFVWSNAKVRAIETLK
ncbi:MAG: hypothetical protein IT227_08670 [Flavobacteriales bacterium]|nr:hypothetical protein [Flavobacteriales bacterium]